MLNESSFLSSSSSLFFARRLSESLSPSVRADANNLEVTANYFADAVISFADDFSTTTGESTIFAMARAGEQSPFFNGCASASLSSSDNFLDMVLLELSFGAGGTGLLLVERLLTNVRGGADDVWGALLNSCDVAVIRQ